MTDALDLDAVERQLTDNLWRGPVYDAWRLLHAARLVHRQARECCGCDGTGIMVPMHATPSGEYRPDKRHAQPCPYCTDTRAALAAIVGETG